jgi:hypothetical protein
MISTHKNKDICEEKILNSFKTGNNKVSYCSRVDWESLPNPYGQKVHWDVANTKCQTITTNQSIWWTLVVIPSNTNSQILVLIVEVHMLEINVGNITIGMSVFNAQRGTLEKYQSI